jgi:ABC-type multidrug transport system fused ATPase/permease subunit
VALTMMPVMFWATMKFREKVRDAFRDTRKQVARLNAFLQEHVTGMQVVQIFNREKEELRRFEEINDAHRKAQVRAIFHFALFWPAVDLIANVALGLVIWYGGLQAMGGALTVGVLIAFIQYVRQFFEPIRNLSDQYNTLQSAMAASERVFDVLDHDVSLPSRLIRRQRDASSGSSSATCGSPTSTCATAASRTGCCGTSRSRWSPARRSRSSGPPGPGRPRSSTCCCGSTRSRRGTS